MIDKYGPAYFSKITEEERAKYDNLIGPAADSKWVGQVPDAPFKKTWHEFVLKRLIREAAEKGFDKVAWTTGEQQAERYDLSKQIDQVDAFKQDDGNWEIGIIKDGKQIQTFRDISSDKIEDYVGKDLADKIINETGEEEKTPELEIIKALTLRSAAKG